jgi:hypothetical protein
MLPERNIRATLAHAAMRYHPRSERLRAIRFSETYAT